MTAIPEKIERETVIAAPVERVWKLLTEADHLGTWFGDAGAEIDLRPGGMIVLRWAEHGTVHGRVERVEPDRVFSYRWAARQDTGDIELGDGNSTLVEFTLSPAGDDTRLRVVESGFSGLDLPLDEQAEKARGNQEGWETKLGDLGDHARRVEV
jgi:uncharacterized protein YndB with AHSA1/START domain